MVDISERVEKVKAMVDRGFYFTINRPRQYGKTTLLSALSRRIYNEYICARISFEGIGDSAFQSESAFCDALMDKIQTALQRAPAEYESSYITSWMNPDITNFKQLDKHITKMCQGKEVVLLIDEVDKTSDDRIFIHFLGVLREKYLLRKDDLDYTFKSVILVGVYDIRNLKLKLINEGVYAPSGQEGHLLNSPWNIAVPFLVDMSFSPKDIAGMLVEYEADHVTGMDIDLVSDSIYEYTGGYPFLVSQICQMLDEGGAPQNWTPNGVRSAVKSMINQVPMNTLFDDIIKNLESDQAIYDFIYDVLILGKRHKYAISDPAIQRADMFGIIKSREGTAIVSNRVFEILIADYFTSKDGRSRSHSHISGYKGDVVRNFRFDMEYCLTRFAKLFREIFTDKDQPFIEEHGRMLFLTYLTPLLNGNGFYHLESQLTDQRRMDLVVDFGADQFIIELKLWYGETAHEKAYNQLAGYLKTKGATAGYLLTFDFRKEKSRESKMQWIDWDGIRIFDVVV
jgi:hypothetical protein